MALACCLPAQLILLKVLDKPSQAAGRTRGIWKYEKQEEAELTSLAKPSQQSLTFSFSKTRLPTCLIQEVSPTSNR